MATSLNGIDLQQYRTQAKDLLRDARAADSQALQRIAQSHPEGAPAASRQGVQLADAQLVIARENGFGSWRAFKEYLLFRQAVRALDHGDIAGLAALIYAHPALLRYRCRCGEWYESGYFAGATLLHHVAGNPIRCPLPQNIVEVTDALLRHGADPNAKTDDGATTIQLLLTSKQSSEMGTAAPVIDRLRAAGARDAYADADALGWALTNSAPATAAELIRRGARMDIRHAAGLGDLDALQRLLDQAGQRDLLEEALAFAAFRGQNEAARILVRHGARGDVLVCPGGHAPQTALHNAANRGNMELVRLLLDNGAETTVRDARWNGTPAGWARHGGHEEIARLIESHTG